MEHDCVPSMERSSAAAVVTVRYDRISRTVSIPTLCTDQLYAIPFCTRVFARAFIASSPPRSTS